MARLRNIPFTALILVLFCNAQIYASQLKDNQQPLPTVNSPGAVENTCSDVQDEGVGRTSPVTKPKGIASIGSRLGNAFNGVGKSLGTVVNGVGKSVGKTADGLGKFVTGTVGGLGQSVNRTAKGLGRLVDDSGEVVVKVAEVAVKVAVVAGIVFLFMEAEPHGYHNHHYHHHRYRDYER